MADLLPNPYFAKAIVHEPEMFFGRTDLLKRVYETVVNRQSVSIVGPRGIGKSSFLWYTSLLEVQAQFPFDLSRHFFVFLDLREYLRRTSEDFFHKVSKAIISEGKKRGLVLYSDGKGEDEFSSILDQIEEQEFFPVLLLDAFDKVTLNEHFDPEFFEYLRAHASMGLVAYVTASIAPLYEVCHRGIAGSPFFNIFYTYRLGALLPEEARELITIPAKQAGILLSNTEMTLVLKWAGYHPYFIQRICYLFWEQKQNASKINVKQLKELVYKELTPIFEDIWENLPKQQKEQLQDEAQQKEHRLRELPELSESAIFRLFIRTICRAAFFNLTSSALEDALETINDLSILGETNLRLMKVISKYLKTQDIPPKAIDKGIAIREILNEALKSLRGSGTQRDNAPDWKYYNILYYRYFKYRLKNEQIAARLCVSVRQYYRERDKAIDLLLNELVALEKSSDTLDLDE